MASSTHTAWPDSTSWPTSTSTLTMVPCIGTVTWPEPAPPPAPLPAARFGFAALGAPLEMTAVCSGTHIATSKRLPLISTVVLRRTRGSASSPDVAGATFSIPERSRTSSTHLVECLKAAKSGCFKIAKSAGMVVWIPSTTISSSARMVRAIAVGRSLPHTMSLPTKLS